MPWLLAGLIQSSVAVGTDDLEAQIGILELKLDVLLRDYTPRHPDVVEVQRELDLLRTAAGKQKTSQPNVEAEIGPSADKSPLQAFKANALKSIEPQALSPRSRIKREHQYVDNFSELCRIAGVIACFDSDSDAPMASVNRDIKGELAKSYDGKIRARLYGGREARGTNSVRMDFRSEDGADHGKFVVTLDAFGAGDLMTVQWRQWFSSELTTKFQTNGHMFRPRIGGGGPKQSVINEIGDPHGCPFGSIVASNYMWNGKIGIYHGCNLWFTPKAKMSVPGDRHDRDVQPGGDNVCRYRYFASKFSRPIGYLYPTSPRNLLDFAKLSWVVHPDRYHGCLGWKEEQWITFRLEVEIQFCKDVWRKPEIPDSCVETPGRLRYWMKYADERKPWLVIDYRMPLRWQKNHSERYGKFSFTAYNTGEKQKPDKPEAFTLYDEIVLARNVESLPWPQD